MPKEPTTLSPELLATEMVWGAIEPLDEAERRRVLEHVVAKAFDLPRFEIKTEPEKSIFERVEEAARKGGLL